MNNENKQADGVGYPPGTRIGKYEITERLGMGGQAIVYKAHDPLLDRYVAIKQISSHLAENPDFLERFRKEAQILARLATSQPALVTIHELLQEERGLFIVMEYVSGNTLESMLSNKPGPIDPKAVLQILWRLAGGLHAVHSAGVIHRDIKPGNIIVGEGLKVKIADFGVAAMSDGQTSMQLGTTKYMAPELYGGKTVDARADMYSLGFIAYEMLLGRAKFNEVFVDVVHDKHSEALRWMKWHGNEQVKAPALDEMNPSIPKALADIVATMMVKNPEHRFATMEQLGRAIKASFSPRSAGGGQHDAGLVPPRTPNGATGPHHGGGPALDTGEDLEVSTESAGPDTAPLPAARMPLKTKLIWAGAGVLALVVVIVAWTAYRHMAGQKVQNQAEAALSEAQGDYKNLRYEDAEAPFALIAKLYAPNKVVDEALKAYKEALKAYVDKSSDKNVSQEALKPLKDKLDDVMVSFDTIVKLNSAPDSPNAVAEIADKSYKDGIDKDGLGQWSEAQGLFKKASMQYAIVAKLRLIGDPGARSSVREHLARARQAVEDAAVAKSDPERQPFWASATGEVDAAKNAWEEAQRRQSKLGPWVAQLEKEMDDFTIARVSCRLFWSAIDEATALFRTRKFDDARRVLDIKLNNSAVHVTKPQDDVLKDLRARIDVGDFEVQFATIMGSAQAAVKGGSFAVAIEDLNKAFKLLKDPLAANITPEARAKHEKEIHDLGEKSRTGGDYTKEMELAKQAQASGDKAGELEHLKNAFEKCPPNEKKSLDDRIKSLQSGMLMDEARKLAADLNFAEARARLEQALKSSPDNQEAKDLLKKITLSEKYQGLLKDAQAAFNRGEFKKGAELYQQALDIDSSDAETQAKLNACLYQIKFAEAEAMILAKKYDQAVKLLEDCGKLIPEKLQDVLAKIEEVKTTREYTKDIDAGNVCLKAKQWSEARKHFNEAAKVKETQEAKDLLLQADYQENLDKGKDAYNQGQWDMAKGYFKMAKEKHDSKEVQEWIAKAQAEINKANSK
jgi:serine/threonine protein kinase/tetratricopeptide (TPR) repeat protein